MASRLDYWPESQDLLRFGDIIEQNVRNCLTSSNDLSILNSALHELALVSLARVKEGV